MGQNLSAIAGKITLDWAGTDVDDDIVSYNIYFSTGASPALVMSNLTPSFFDVSVAPNNTYYWKVITKDAKGNTSDSGVYQVKVN